MRMRRATAVAVISATLLLAGCATNPQAAADTACADETENVYAYRDAVDGDLRLGELVESVEAVIVVSPATEVPEGGAFIVEGTAQLTSDTHSRYGVSWLCFSQTVDGVTHASVVEWSRL